MKKTSKALWAFLVLCLLLPCVGLADEEGLALVEALDVTDQQELEIRFTGGEIGVEYTLYHKHRSIWKEPLTLLLEDEAEAVFVVTMGLGMNDFVLRESGEPRDAEGGLWFSIEYAPQAEPTERPDAAGPTDVPLAGGTLAPMTEETAGPKPDAAPEATAEATPEATEEPAPEPTEEPVAGPTPEPSEEPVPEPIADVLKPDGDDDQRALTLWSTGNDVEALQEGLTALGYKTKVDGVYGPRTRSAVARFQKAYDLKVDGIAGAEVRAKLLELGVAIPEYIEPDLTMPEGFERALSYGKQGEDVLRLQEALLAQGYLEGKADQVYGKKTRSAVRAFQKENGLKVDGVAGPETLRLLFGE